MTSEPRFHMATVVTAGMLSEFMVLRYSFELFHGDRHLWFVRADREAAAAIERCPRTRVEVFADRFPERIATSSKAFLTVVQQKMNVIEDAWCDELTETVVFVDADIIFTGALNELVSGFDGDALLTPNYYPADHQHIAPLHGYFNTGFIATRNRRFHDRWRQLFEAQPWLFADQACMNDVAREFAVSLAGPEANVGFWRSSRWAAFAYDPLPDNSLFLHCHLYRGLSTRRGWIDRTFGLHITRFLLHSPDERHHLLAEELLRRDTSGWYTSTLRLVEGTSLTAPICE